MACDCELYQCLSTVKTYASCPNVVTLLLPSPITGQLQWEYEFNGRWKGGSIDVTEGDDIVLPYVFNENYVHSIKFYNDNTLLNETCYSLDTSTIAGSYLAPSTQNDSYLNVTLTEEMLSVNDEEQQVVTIPAINGRTIIFIADGNQLYNIASFSQDETEFTMTNGAAFYAGQIITLLFG